MKQQANYNQVHIDFLKDVIEGLSKDPKILKPKYFYDNKGAQLFTEICTTPEYYPTRTEIKILNQNAEDIASQIGDNTALIEYGSGALEKIKILLNFLNEPVGLIPVDISEDQLFASAKNLENFYPNLEILPVAADFTKPIPIPTLSHPPKKRVAFFPGSTIGNFEPDLAIQFLEGVTKTIGIDGLLLIGFDLKKDTETLLAAYDDQRGITAAFNKNLLSRINDELDGNFNLDTFEHLARYNDNEGRIEMHLRSTAEQTVLINKELFKFLEGETIHTENCYKFTEESFTDMSIKAGLSPVKTWTDDQNLFAVMLLRATSNL
ncbi:MAG: L-histidine N(alpha)-methyltransferase [Rhodospirillaceae bacterium]|nr:L-histidine N(alpha)-methyltransferase [Rhodospirillaceae bacterium]